MNSQQPGNSWQRSELLTLLSLAGTLAGLCITGVTLFGTMKKAALAQTIADDLLTAAALIFLLCTYFIFLALKSTNKKIAWLFEKLADFLFLTALTSMVGSGIVMIYSAF